MKILFDENMPFAAQCFETLGHAIPFTPNQLTDSLLRDADALMIRSTTKIDHVVVDAAPNLSFVATATAGFNHIDTALLEQRNIPWFAAAGCNAVAVAEYVVSGLLAYAMTQAEGLASLQAKRIAIVGAGNVGSALATKLCALNIPYVLFDPPLAESGDSRVFVDFETVLSCDIICLHVPYTTDGLHPTHHLIDKDALMQLKSSQLVVNGCRGGVIDETAFKELATLRDMPSLILDAWQGEPDIDPEMIEHALYATAHIAGHSLEGKSRGTFMAYEAYCQRVGQAVGISMDDVVAPLPAVNLTIEQMSDQQLIEQIIFSLYDIREDDRIFRQAMAQSGSIDEQFTALRKHYAIRREFAAQPLCIPNECRELSITQQLADLGFPIQFI